MLAMLMLDIDDKTSIRGTRKDGEEYFSVLDCITYVFPGNHPSYAGTKWHHMTSLKSKSRVPVPEFFKYKIDTRKTPCMTITKLKMLMHQLCERRILPLCDRALECFNQVLAGDRSRIRETQPLGLVQGAAQDPEQGAAQGAAQGPAPGPAPGPAQGAEQGAAPGPAQQIALPGAWDPQDPSAYTVQEGAPVSHILTGMLGPLCDENRDASHKLQLKIQELHAQDPAKAAMKVEVWSFKGDGTMWVNTTSVIKYIYTGSVNNIPRTLQSIFARALVPHKFLQVPQYAGDPKPKHVYLTDMNDLYHVAVRMHGWDFMAEASHINAQKAVRGLASDLQEFHAQAQDNSAAQLMQQGAAAGEAAAQITGEEAEMQREERRLELKRKAVDLELSGRERELAMDIERFKLKKESKEWETFFPIDTEKKKIEVIGLWITFIETVDPDWKQNKKLQTQARDRLVSVMFGPPAIQDSADAVLVPREC